jgi:glycosyltransferase involved in cell wall biosynthesis
MEPSRILDGYDVVDNKHFAEGASAARDDMSVTRSRLKLPEQYFLASSRLIPRKNLKHLIAAYDLYQRQTGAVRAWSLVILGYGSQEEELRAEVAKRGLLPWVHLMNFQPYNKLPAYYGLAGAFVHPALTEPWGLVVNEAMAAGVVPLVSKTSGCAPDLVTDGETGFQFDPRDAGQLCVAMTRVSGEPALRTRLAKNAEARIQEWSPDRFAGNFMLAAQIALSGTHGPPSRMAKTCIRILLRRT